MFSQVLTISKFTIIESMRNRLLWLSLLVVAISFGLVEFIGDLAITEQRATQVALLASFLRLSAVVMVALFVVSSTLRELQDKTLEMILAMQIHRSAYYMGKLTGFIQVALVVSLIVTLLLLLYAPVGQVMIWGYHCSWSWYWWSRLAWLCCLHSNRYLRHSQVYLLFMQQHEALPQFT